MSNQRLKMEPNGRTVDRHNFIRQLPPLGDDDYWITDKPIPTNPAIRPRDCYGYILDFEDTQEGLERGSAYSTRRIPTAIIDRTDIPTMEETIAAYELTTYLKNHPNGKIELSEWVRDTMGDYKAMKFCQLTTIHSGRIKCVSASFTDIRGSIDNRYFNKNMMTPSNEVPEERLRVQLEFRKNGLGTVSLAVLSPVKRGDTRQVFGWARSASECPDNDASFDAIQELTSMQHKVLGYVIPGDTFKHHRIATAFPLNETRRAGPAIESDNDDDLDAGIEPVSVKFEVHWASYCPLNVDLYKVQMED
ncbi:hypothetical protein BJ508DRAFT_313638 [Ascobolus immersus RN42]|uniref:Uncharacterized protein n=1 Tax=Ascobolus immersus RN42 TaxID=1160509 RepID=A0A3N4HL25_ASCIM|nr:hypothetical protein BJ508DRAFT_313638 [Ascobolus immersus RN42]